MARLMRAHDWSGSPVGPMRDWPDSLRVTLNILLAAEAQIVLFWGPELAAFYNDAYAPTIGQKHPVALGRPASEGWAELWDDLGPLLRAVLQKGETVGARDRPFQINRKGYMEDVWFDISYSPVRGPEGRVEGVLCIVSETTERVLGTRALQQREAQLRELGERMNLALNAGAVLGTWVWDVRADRFHADERFARTFVLDAGALQQGMRIEEVKQSIHPEDIAHVNSMLAAVLASGGPYSAEYRVPREGGGWRWIEANGHVELDAKGRPLRFPGVLVDVDRRRAAEEVLRDMNALLEKRVEERSQELRATQSRLHESQKMEALGQLTGGVAHDFNNILQGITAAVEVMRRRAALGQQAEVERNAERALSSARRAAGLVQRLLAFARRQSLDAKAVNVSAMAGSLEDFLRRTLGENIRLEVSAPEPVFALCDENQLESAVLNLCINARDAMPQGGTLAVSVSRLTLAAGDAFAAGLESAGDYARVEVRDTGVGMDDRALARAFEPFFTTKPAGQGTGLGLSMIYGFARQSGGAIQLASSPGRGTTATLYLPCAGSAAAAEADAGARLAAPSQQGEGKIVLAVEDDAVVRAGLLEWLRELGYRTLEAVDADSALRLLSSSGRVDLMVSDVGLPGMNGRQLSELAQKQCPGLRTLLVTGYTQAAMDRGEFLGDGIALLTKPYDMAQLARALQKLCESPA